MQKGPSLETMQQACLTEGGNLKDGIKGAGQYCYLRADGVKYTFDEAKIKCDGLSGNLPMLTSQEAQTMFQDVTCSSMDKVNPGSSKCPGVSTFK